MSSTADTNYNETTANKGSVFETIGKSPLQKYNPIPSVVADTLNDAGQYWQTVPGDSFSQKLGHLASTIPGVGFAQRLAKYRKIANVAQAFTGTNEGFRSKMIEGAAKGMASLGGSKAKTAALEPLIHGVMAGVDAHRQNVANGIPSDLTTQIKQHTREAMLQQAGGLKDDALGKLLISGKIPSADDLQSAVKTEVLKANPGLAKAADFHDKVTTAANSNPDFDSLATLAGTTKEDLVTKSIHPDFLSALEHLHGAKNATNVDDFSHHIEQLANNPNIKDQLPNSPNNDTIKALLTDELAKTSKVPEIRNQMAECAGRS